MFQSKVGRGLRPTPEIVPKTAMTATEVGLIQVIQLKYESAWKREPGSQK